MEIDQNLFLIKEEEGYQKDFSILISMMNYARFTTLADLEDVSPEEVDYRYNEDFN